MTESGWSPARTFGPVPSRRFGQSLGLNTIPPKTCSYSCVYCQVGRTDHLTLRREPHCDPGELFADVKYVLGKLRERAEKVDYITFVPDGEPTLDCGLGDQIRMLKPLGVPVAVITNASLLSNEEVRNDLSGADRVSVKVDAVRVGAWRRIDRPHGDLRLDEVLNGVREFRRQYHGELDTETMLVAGMNDGIDDLRSLAAFLEPLQPHRSYISIPTRPPAVAGTQPPAEDVIVRAYACLAGAVDHVELLTGYEGAAFSTTGDASADLLAITAVHPMRADQVEALLDRCGATWDSVVWLVRRQKLSEVRFGEHLFYVRRFTPQ